MKLVRVVGIAALFLFFGTAVPIYAQQEQPVADKPAQHDEQQPSADRQEDKAKPEKQEEAKPGKQEEGSKPGKQEEAKPGRQEEQAKPGKQEEHAKPGKQEEQAKPVQREQGEQRMQGRGGKGGRIPDDKFRAQFGREHRFRMSRPTVVEGQPRFQYGGYWFVMVDPWPAGWLYTDECYIDYVDDQYYLFDVLHPGVSIVLTVVM
jgi:hypothetical protein